MKAIICPISTERINRNVVRITGLMMASMIALYAYTGAIYFIVIVAIDYSVRAFTPLKYSPFSWLAYQIAELLKFSDRPIDKAPKIFAARVGFLFTLATTTFYFIHSATSLAIALTLMGFALLEGLFDFCVGCLVYTYIVLPLFEKPSTHR